MKTQLFTREDHHGEQEIYLTYLIHVKIQPEDAKIY